MFKLFLKRVPDLVLQNIYKIIRTFAWCLSSVDEANLKMYLHRNLENPELIDLLVMHTNRLTQIMIYGERFFGEYEICKRTIELIQNEILSRRNYFPRLAIISYFNQSSAAKN